MSIYLGFDSSTQSLTVLAIEIDGSRRRRIFEHSLEFDVHFPAYGTRNGVLPADNPLVAHSPPLLWVEALDVLMGILAKESGIPLEQVCAISGSGQQHGSVYLNNRATAALEALDPARPLADQIETLLSRRTSPIWMDSSTAEECREITEAIGGDKVLAALTGSRAFERFTGPQIRKFSKEDARGYARTDKIHLVSSFMASLLAGKHAPIDPGDGAGMNLMGIVSKLWAPAALRATAEGLETKLSDLKESWSMVGNLSSYWVRRYGFSPRTKVISWSGDNPCSLIGVGLVKQGKVAISLGTSTTFFGFLPRPIVDPTGSGHVFGSPTGDYMSLICFENGGLARDEVRKEHGLDWQGFSMALRSTPPGNRGGVMLPWFKPEITPRVHQPGVRRYHLDPRDGAGNVRAVVEAQMMAISNHSQWMGVSISTVHATGGSAVNRDILQVMADVLDAEVYQFQISNSAALGAALRAYHADGLTDGNSLPWEKVVAGFAEPLRESRIKPRPEAVKVYARLKPIYAACEAHSLRGGEDPSPGLLRFR